MIVAALGTLERLLENGGPLIYILAIVLTVIPAFITAMSGRRPVAEPQSEPAFSESSDLVCGFDEDAIYEIAHRAATEALRTSREHGELHLGRLFLNFEQRLIELQRAIASRD